MLEQVPRPWAARRFWPDDSALGQHAVISLYAHIHVKIHHGIVPVEEDGSAHFIVPADKNLFFQALDENFMEVQRMRTFVNLQPGESRSCIGCHESRTERRARRSAGPAAQPPIAPARSRARPCRGRSTIRRTCSRSWTSTASAVTAATKTEGTRDLSGEPTTFFNRSYENVMSGKW